MTETRTQAEHDTAEWRQEFTFDEVTLALAQFAIARGDPMPYRFDMSQPVLTKLNTRHDPHSYLRLSYPAKAQETK